MYESFYGVGERPFTLLPDPDFLFLSDKHQAALDMLEMAISSHSGFCVVSGEIGAGKTTLIREILNRLDDSVLRTVCHAEPVTSWNCTNSSSTSLFNSMQRTSIRC